MMVPLKNISRWSILSLTVLLSLLLVSSICVLHKVNQSGYPHFTPDDLVRYASLYLPGNKLGNYGRRLDCSGFTKSVFRHFHQKIPRSSSEQSRLGKRLNIDQLNKGDLIFFATSGNRISHVGLYLGNQRFIHSPDKNQDVRVDSLNGPYWHNNFRWGISIIRK